MHAQLKGLIQQEALAAEDNLRFLMCLQEPCSELAAAAPADVPKLLPKILDCIRMVWALSQFYNTPDRITGLLGKLSNQIISRCCAVIDLEQAFSGEVTGLMDTLQQCIAAGECCCSVVELSGLNMAFD